MDIIKYHVEHTGKGKTRVTRCIHCNNEKVFKSLKDKELMTHIGVNGAKAKTKRVQFVKALSSLP